MAFTAKNLTNAELGVSVSTLYTVPANTKTRVTEILLCNASGAVRTATLYYVESGDSADDGAGAGVNSLMDAFNLPQGTPMAFPMNSFLEPGDTIQGKASGVDVFVHISGIEDYTAP